MRREWLARVRVSVIGWLSELPSAAQPSIANLPVVAAAIEHGNRRFRRDRSRTIRSRLNTDSIHWPDRRSSGGGLRSAYVNFATDQGRRIGKGESAPPGPPCGRSPVGESTASAGRPLPAVDIACVINREPPLPSATPRRPGVCPALLVARPRRPWAGRRPPSRRWVHPRASLARDQRILIATQRYRTSVHIEQMLLTYVHSVPHPRCLGIGRPDQRR